MEKLRKNLLPLALALLLHAFLAGVLIFGFGWTPKLQSSPPRPTQVVQATVVAQDKVAAEVKPQQRAEQKASVHQQKMAQQLAEAQQNIAEAQRKQQEMAERARQEAQRKQQEMAERARQEAEKQQQVLAQKQRQEQERLKQLQAARKAEEEARRRAAAEKKRAEEEKRRAEAEKRRLEAERRKAEEEAARRKAEEERKQAEAVARQKAEEERRRRELQARIEAEQDVEQQQRIEAAVNRFITQVSMRVQRYWIRPMSARDHMVAVLQVQLLPSGEVRSVKVIESSGDRAFDRSAERAVYKASPLPVPADPAAVERLLSFNFKFTPGS